MTTLHKFRIYRETDSKWEYIWKEEDAVPVTCPANTVHDVNLDSASKVDILQPNITLIDSERTPLGQLPTGRNYRLITKAFDAPANQTTTTQFSFKYPVSIHAAQLTTEAKQRGDIVSVEGGKDTVIGVLTDAVALNDTEIPVSPTVIANLQVGRHVSLTDGVNTTPYIAVVSINTNTNVITLDTGTPYAFVGGSFVRMTVYLAQEVEIGHPGDYKLGSRTQGATYIPANTVQTVTYVNTTADAKRVCIVIETTY